tara:strand:+ start:2573 stop:2962 length:390 start_codon:yes stop_codon:yes gene_type:complete
MIYEEFEGQNGTWKVIENGNIEITLTKEGVEELEDLKDNERVNVINESELLWELFEDIFCNSAFELLQPEDVGALTDSVILGYEIPRNDDGEIQKFHEDSKVWWFPNYMITSIYDELITDGKSYLVVSD